MRDRREREATSAASWKFDRERVAVEMMITLERFDQQIVRGKPDWSAPVRVAAEKSGVRIARHVRRLPLVPAVLQRLGARAIRSRERTHAVLRQEFRFVENVTQHALD